MKTPAVTNSTISPVLSKTLHYASAEECRVLLDQGANVNELDSGGRTALYCAAVRGDIEKIMLLADAYADPNVPAVVGGWTALHIATKPEVVAALLSIGADVAALDNGGRTPYEVQKDIVASGSEVLKMLAPPSAPSRGHEGADDAAANHPGTPARRVFDLVAAHALHEELASSQDTRSLAPLLKRVACREGEPGHRPLSLAPTPDAIATLRQDFPNFGPVIDLIERRSALARMADGAFALPPLLLVGPPGVGKTHFAHRLATLTATPFHEISMATASTGWMLSGLDRSWNGGKPGLVFRALCVDDDAVANPLFLLDEIDKVCGASNNASRADAALYTLLEPSSAKRFEDECLPFPIDASAMVIIATANELDTIPSPLLSRFEVFHIEAAAPAERRAIARSVHAHVCASNPWGSHFTDALDEGVMDVLVHEYEDARSIRKAITDACAVAAMRGENKVRVSDIPRARTNTTRRRVGFV